MIVQNGSRQYHVGDLVAETPEYRLYMCSIEGSEQGHLLQVVVDVTHNGTLDRAAHFLRKLARHAEVLERKFEAVKEDPEAMLNYQYSMPDLVDSFLSPEQGNRHINILRFHNVDDVRRMVPLYNITHRDQQRIDIRSSVWIMGKFLKILTFVHDASLSMKGLITAGNILIEPKEHYVVIFNWADAQHEDSKVPSILVRDDIKCAAECVIEMLGGKEKGGIPDDGSEEFAAYTSRLVSLAEHGDRDAHTAHREFYIFVDSLWPRGYHPFTSLPL